ncbi:MAG: hypothetical protein EBY17_25040 [Acidobacteriia bacterium]|nr:hypothetical protein [Terriglobia bacterium]
MKSSAAALPRSKPPSPESPEKNWTSTPRRENGTSRPTLTPFNQDSWADNLDYEDADIAEAFTTFHVLRNDTAKLLSNLPPEVFEYTGLHLERGELTLLSLVEIFGNHVLKHADQIKAARKAFKALAGLKAK